jgi:hypothetical protein
MRTRIRSIAPTTLKSLGLVVIAMIVILVVLPAALVAAGT